MTLRYAVDTASVGQVADHLRSCDAGFVPPLSTRIEIDSYAKKIATHATRFEAWSNGTLVGLVAAYFGDAELSAAHITNVSVWGPWADQGIATRLLQHCVDHGKRSGTRVLTLEVSAGNAAARRLYAKAGFRTIDRQSSGATMRLHLNDWTGMSDERDYNVEIEDNKMRRYAYGFDFDVMHPYMIRSFEPFFRKGSLLELGSFNGEFTRRFRPYFDDITCVEASDNALADARLKLGEQVKFVHARFEVATLPARYDNIVLTHVLEHLDDPIRVLRRINDEWLADGGRLFLVCPNANAPSRQIAVKMGLITHNTAVTPAEAAHGHRCTYTLDTLERDAVGAGLNVVHRSGIFFKALANFQWDRLMQTDIISKDYLDGCYKLGQQYPDLCSSIFLLCERGETARPAQT
jgi:ribosomal protein S18 acetylase RimI-like enzyme/SAM-dependent methyltransferase